ncbi:phage tail protein [Aquisalinus flavus]|uniref:Tail Collar domain-containing protein n=1 Tax=Aquisalinus flavus TaxID=1526572 RepID=A0A8J2V0Z9_9PROT|nr:tail fiber protein [Aquisalinus flavus]MBD0426976.1 tail fiber protein [Aquisalinus flavus]UNE46809.1 phage tail protein [Aquisalinus flavus]GGC97391.1 tail Collar domain-containing protein [Aquisalinus flavus]
MRKLLAKAAAASGLALGALSSVAPAAAQLEPFVGQMMLTGSNFCPRGWAPVEGQTVAISSNTALFALLGTTYGGNGTTTFGLPDLRGRSAIHEGTGPGLPTYPLGDRGGQSSFTLSILNLPSHTHTVNATHLTADKGGPQDRYLGGGIGDDDDYHDGPPTRTMAAGMISPTGSGQPVDHRGPYIAMQWCIAMEGYFPPRN